MGSVFFCFLPKKILRGFQYTSFILFFFIHFFTKYLTLVCTQNLQLKIPRKHSNSILAVFLTTAIRICSSKSQKSTLKDKMFKINVEKIYIFFKKSHKSGIHEPFDCQ